MKEIKRFKEGDHIPSNARFICQGPDDVVKDPDFIKETVYLRVPSFFYEVPIVDKKEQSFIPDLIVNDVVSYLNEATGKSFKPVGKTAQLIKDRIKTDKATYDDFINCIDNMVAEWSDNPKMKIYLRPATLFQASKFAGYVNHKSINQEVSDAFKDLGDYC